MTTFEAHQRAKKKYNARFEMVSFRVPKGDRDKIKQYAESHGESINSMFQRLIKEEMERNP